MTTKKKEINIKPESSKQKRFPDGKDPKDYEECTSWTYRKWAWEFLCRNVEFQKASDLVIDGTEDDMKSVANKYGLVNFMYYAEVQTKKSVCPTFIIGAIKSFVNLGSECKKEEITLYPGQIAIRFRLTAKSNVQQLLDTQITKAKAKLEMKAAEFHEILGKRVGRINPKATLFPIYLRILDMQAKGLNKQDITRILNNLPPESTTKFSGVENIDSITRQTNRHIKSAEKCASTLYRYIVLRPDKK